MIVRFWMTRDLVLAREDMSLYQVFTLMKQHRIRRLPVAREQQLVGIISQSDLFQIVSPAQFQRALLPDGVKEQLEARRVDGHMTKTPLTCGPNDALEDVGALMCARRVRALPVVRDGKLVGIITDSDVLRALTRVACAGDDSRRISMQVPVAEKTRVYARVIELCNQHKLELVTLLSHPSERPELHSVTLRVRGAQVERFVEELWKTHYQVMQVV